MDLRAATGSLRSPVDLLPHFGLHLIVSLPSVPPPYDSICKKTVVSHWRPKLNMGLAGWAPEFQVIFSFFFSPV